MSIKDKWNKATNKERAFYLEGIKLTISEYNQEKNKSYNNLSDFVKKFINFPSCIEYKQGIDKNDK